MTISKYVLRIASRHPLYLLIYVGFVSLLGVLMIGTPADGGTSAGDATQPAAYRARVAVVDRDGSALSRALQAYLKETDTVIEIEDESYALQDALATEWVNAVIIVPEGFSEDLIRGARSGGELPDLEVAAGGDMQASALLGERARRWASLAAADAALDRDASEDAVAEDVQSAAAKTVSSEIVRTEGQEVGRGRVIAYLRFGSYTVTCSIVVVVGVVLTEFSEPEVRRRQLASPVSTWGHAAQVLAGCAVLTLLVCVWVFGVGIVAAGAESLLETIPLQLLLAFAALAAFALVPFSLAFLLAQLGFREEALNAVANLGAMVMSFLGGSWISLSLLGDSVQAIARFSPTYWMSDAVAAVLEPTELTQEALTTAGIDIAIILLFAAACASAGFAIARARRTA